MPFIPYEIAAERKAVMTGFALRRIIDGVAYDTETATLVARGYADPDGQVGSDASWSLYQKRDGAWFEVVFGHDGAVEELNPLTTAQARYFLEVNANHLVERHFGPMPEAGPIRFSRRTVIAAIEMMEPFNHAQLTRYLLKLGSELARKVGEKGYIAQRLNKLIALAVDDLPPNYAVEGGEVLQDVLVENAVSLLPGYGYSDSATEEELLYLPPRAAEFLRALERDGFTVSGGLLRRTLPIDIGLPTTQSEVDRLLVKHGFTVPKGQLEQAIDAHARGNWAGANGQFRPFLEGLLEAIATKLAPSAGDPVRGLLAIGFLRRDLNERDFMYGLIKRLHSEGPHPGLSGDEDSTFRFHVVLLSARLLLTRFDTWATA